MLGISATLVVTLVFNLGLILGFIFADKSKGVRPRCTNIGHDNFLMLARTDAFEYGQLRLAEIRAAEAGTTMTFTRRGPGFLVPPPLI